MTKFERHDINGHTLGEPPTLARHNPIFANTSSTALFARPSPSPPHYPMSLNGLERKVKKPLMEKKRRARMNVCFDKLKELLLHSDLQQSSKLEKADVLEKTVVYMTQLKQENHRLLQQVQQIANSDAGRAYQNGIREGFSACASATAECLQRVALPPPFGSQEYRGYLRQSIGERLASVFGRISSTNCSLVGVGGGGGVVSGDGPTIFPTTTSIVPVPFQHRVNGASGGSRQHSLRWATNSSASPSTSAEKPQTNPLQYLPFAPAAVTAATLAALQSYQQLIVGSSPELTSFSSPPPSYSLAVQVPLSLAAPTNSNNAPSLPPSGMKSPTRSNASENGDEKIDVEEVTTDGGNHQVESANQQGGAKPLRCNDDSGISVRDPSSSSSSPKTQASTSPTPAQHSEEKLSSGVDYEPPPSKVPKLHRPYL